MQKIATWVFIIASATFGLNGVIMVLSGSEPDDKAHGFQLVQTKIMMASVFIILSSFALSIAGKYLKPKK